MADAATERYNADGESLDAFMRRTAHVNAPASLRRMAWALDKPIQEVVDAHALAHAGRTMTPARDSELEINDGFGI